MKSIKNFLIFFLFFILGVTVFFYPVLYDTSIMPGDLIDVRFIHYILEHGFLFLNGDSLHSSFWNMPLLYPTTNTLAFSDVMLGGMLFYIPLRYIFNPQTSLQIVVIIFSFLNFYSFYLLARNIFKFNNILSSLGAFLFAFSLARYNQIYHIQLLTQFFSVFGLYFIFKNNAKIRDFIISAIFFAVQFYTSFYYIWMTVFSLFVLFLIMFLKKDTREIIFNFLKNKKAEIICFAVTFLILISPLLYHYLQVDYRFELKHKHLFNLFSPFVSFSFLDYFILKPDYNYFDIEAITGIGFFITLISAIGWFKLKKYKLQTFLFIFILSISFYIVPIYDFIFKYVPGGLAIRAGARIIFILLFPLIFFILNYLKNIKNKTAFFVILILIIFESLPLPIRFEWTKKDHIKRMEKYEIPKNCKSFYLKTNEKDYKKKAYIELDAMWLSNKVKKPTLNGFYSFDSKYDKKDYSNTCIIDADL